MHTEKLVKDKIEMNEVQKKKQLRNCFTAESQNQHLR